MPKEEDQSWPESFTEERDFCFHDIEYSIRVNITDDRFFLEAQNVESGELWRNCFEKAYIEDITRKASSFKKYNVFTKMLLDAMECNGDTNCPVSINLHSYEHLEKLIQTKSKVSNRAKNKRYLILTYEAEYDRVQYPLCLKYTTPSSGEMLKELARLRRQVKYYRGNEKQENEITEVDLSKRLAGENQRLKLRYDSQAQSSKFRDKTVSLQDEVEELRLLLQQKDEELSFFREADSTAPLEQLENTLMRVEKENEELVHTHSKEIKRMTKELATRDDQIDKLQSQVDRLRSRISKLQIDHEKILNEKSALTLSRYKSKGQRRRRFRSSISPANSLRKSSTERKVASSYRRSKTNASFRTRRNSFSYRSRSSSLRNTKRSAASDAGCSSRCSSARRGRSPCPRFDPTAWVQSRREKSNSRSKSRGWGKPPSKRRTRSVSPYGKRSSSVELSPRSEAIQQPWRNKLRNSAPVSLSEKAKKQRIGAPRKRPLNRKKKLNADEQIENIDSRLSALQTFLEAAKANGEY